MWHTLAQAIELTGRSRRSLYRDMDAGRVSFRVRDDGRRELETSELMRAYGPLKNVAQPSERVVAQVGIAPGTSDLVEELRLLRAEYQAGREENRLLREEVAGLRAELRLLEHKPSKTDENRQVAQAKPNGGKQPPSAPVKTFADLLNSLS